MADGVLSIKGTLVGARGSGSGGHVIKDNGNAVTQRPTMNMTDFDIADDNTNEETDIKPHRLTSSELSDICSPLPDDPTVVGNVRMSLLWTNPNPSASFEAQNINIATLSNYDLYLISEYGKGISVISETKGCLVFAAPSTANAGTVSYVRSFTINTTTNKVSFTDAVNGFVGRAEEVNNALLIPYRIYGIKLL